MQNIGENVFGGGDGWTKKALQGSAERRLFAFKRYRTFKYLPFPL